MYGVPALLACCGGILLAGLGAVRAQTPPNSYPHVWPGQPRGPLSPLWQHYFEVKGPLPNLTHARLPRSFAGNIPVDRPGHPNDTFFFWGFEREGKPGGLTAPAFPHNDEPWILWVQGGPGSSGLLGLAVENGPIHVLPNYTWTVNPYSWNKLADTIWIDQPVGTGFSTADTTGYVADEDQMAVDFINFLRNLVKVFPSLATRPLYLAGESYAGFYIPYLLKHLLPLEDPPVNLRKIAIGNGFIGSYATNRETPVITLLESFPDLIGYDPDVFNYFKEQHHLCGFDLNLTYPQTDGTFPPLKLPLGQIVNQTNTSALVNQALFTTPSLKQQLASKYAARVQNNVDVKRSDVLERREEARAQWKRDLSGRPNGTVDPWYGCDVWEEMWDYALNFTFPWTNGGLDTFDIPDATFPEPTLDASVFLNDPRVRAALHAPLSKNWTSAFTYPFGNVYLNNTPNMHGDLSIEPIVFFTELFANSSAKGVPWVFYSGNDDSQDAHRSTEVVIQNFTFGGIQGFTKKPSTPWYDDDGAFAGVVHQERNVSYVLFDGAGHLIPEYKPQQSLVFLREFILGDNPNGTVLDNGTVVGGENATLAGDYLFGGGQVFYGSAATEGTVIAPPATIASWDSFLATATLVAAPTTTAPPTAVGTASSLTSAVDATTFSTTVVLRRST
ncbi:alpha/beta-hydrolase [Dichomitus squalens]|uniref:Carboxypeptidase n=1 Tax=Dichomitus squalens TaxID=114155 RepID=A0A4Q9Q8B5_9APHY|nr:alpha/beta-hydrolase [Dichomitus squalens]